MWGEWIQKTIQGFRIPASQISSVTPVGLVPARMEPVFLDRSELPAGGALNERLRKALEQSQFLLVLCSPNSVRSDYVGQEIQTFKEMHGWQRIIPVVIAGEVGSNDETLNAIRIELRGMMPCEGEQDRGGSLAVPRADQLPLFVDFRVRKAEPGQKKEFGPGWTDPRYYDHELKNEGKTSSRYRRTLVGKYAREHKNQKYKLLAALLGLKPRDLEDDSNAEELRRQRNAKRLALALAGVTLVLAVTAWVFYSKANHARADAERSVLMIGDAHENASRLVSDLLVNLKASLKTTDAESALEEAGRTVSEYLDASEPTGQDDDSRHMRSVVLNSRGYFARRQGDYTGAEKSYQESLALRRSLAASQPDNPLWQQSLALSLDNLGDLHAAKAQDRREKRADPGSEYIEALRFYRESLSIVETLADRRDARPAWRHELAVGYFKIGDVLFQDGNMDAALPVLLNGLSVAEKAAESDPEYAKWQADLGLYCLEIGQILGATGKDAEARKILKKGQAIFDRLRDRKHLTSDYAKRLEEIETSLKDLAP